MRQGTHAVCSYCVLSDQTAIRVLYVCASTHALHPHAVADVACALAQAVTRMRCIMLLVMCASAYLLCRVAT